MSDAFEPFRYFDMASFYNSYTQAIDGIIFFGLFLGLSKAVFRQKFGGRPGNAISIFFALALTIGLLVAERMFNFNLKSFGWLAIMVLMLVVGFFIFNLGHSFGLRRSTALALAHTTLYSSIAFVAPNIFDFFHMRARWINGLLGILFLISLMTLLWRTFRRITGRRHRSPTFIDTPDRDISVEKAEIRDLKSLRLKLTSVDEIIDALHQIETVIQSETLDESGTSRLRRHLAEIAMRENVLRNNYNLADRKLKALGRVDAERLERLIAEAQELEGNRRNLKEKEIDLEKRKIEYDRQIIEIKTHLDGHINVFNGHLKESIEKIKISTHDAIPCIKEARRTLVELKKLIHAIQQLEKELIDLHRMQKGLFKTEKRKR